MNKIIKINADKLMAKEVFVNVILTHIRVLKWKLWILKWLFRLAAYITGYKIVVEDMVAT